MKLFLMGLSILSIAGCATSKAIVGPDGTQNHLITCNGIEYCYEKAREVCRGNYKIVNTSTDVSGDAHGSTSSSVNLLVKCDR